MFHDVSCFIRSAAGQPAGTAGRHHCVSRVQVRNSRALSTPTALWPSALGAPRPSFLLREKVSAPSHQPPPARSLPMDFPCPRISQRCNQMACEVGFLPLGSLRVEGETADTHENGHAITPWSLQPWGFPVFHEDPALDSVLGEFLGKKTSESSD